MSYKCPNCGADKVFFILEKEKWRCEYCDSECNFEKDEQGESAEYEEYNCSLCGTKIITTKDDSILHCIFCGNKELKKKKIIETFELDGIIPFKIQEKEAVQIYEKYLKERKYEKNKRDNLLILGLKGIYIPAYIYDMKLDVYSRGKCTYNDGESCDEYLYETSFSTRFIAEQSSSFICDDNLIVGVEPFDLSVIFPYKQAVINGFCIERSNITPSVAKDKHITKIRYLIEYEILEQFKKIYNAYEYYNEDRLSIGGGKNCINVKKEKYKKILIPIYIVCTLYKGKKYLIAINGQNGNIDSELPENKIDKIKLYLKLFIIMATFILLYISFVTRVIIGEETHNIFSFIGKIFDKEKDINDIFGIFSIIISVFGIIMIIRSFAKKNKKKNKLGFENIMYDYFRKYHKKEYENKFREEDLEKRKEKIFYNGISKDGARWEDEINI